MKNLKLIGLMVIVFLATAACKLGSSPTATFKAFYEAQKKKDVAAIKKTLSKGSLAMLEKTAKDQNKTVDAAISEGLEKPGSKTEKMPEIRNEKIDGNNGTLEVQDDDTKKWDTMYFVKEDGDWKIAIDKMIEEALKKLGQSP